MLRCSSSSSSPSSSCHCCRSSGQQLRACSLFHRPVSAVRARACEACALEFKRQQVCLFWLTLLCLLSGRFLYPLNVYLIIFCCCLFLFVLFVLFSYSLFFFFEFEFWCSWGQDAEEDRLYNRRPPRPYAKLPYRELAKARQHGSTMELFQAKLQAARSLCLTPCPGRREVPVDPQVRQT